MNKKIKIAIALVIVLALVGVGVIGYLRYQDQQIYNATYITIDGVEYERAVTTLDLSGQSISELDKLKELTALESLNLRNTGITPQQYDDLQAALPECRIAWSVPFQDTYYNNDITVLDVTTLSEADLDVISRFSHLNSLRALGCTDYDALVTLMERYPNLNVIYTVELSGKDHFNYADSLTIADPDLKEFREKIAYLPKVTTVSLTGTLPAKEELLKLKEEFPDITFSYDFEVLGIEVNSLDEFLDLSGMKFENIEEVEAILPYFYNLTQIDMVNCGFSNDTMDALNKRHPDVKFVWTVNVCGLTLRTDVKYFMPVQHKINDFSAYGCMNLRYCTDIEVLDFGHYGISNVDFVQYLPKLKYVLMCEATITDVSTIAKCITLEYLEIQSTPLTDFWPLTNLTNLRDLNIGGTPSTSTDGIREYGSFGDYTSLLQMTWLDRLWLPFTIMSNDTRATIQEALPNTMIVFRSGGTTTGGYRYTPRYFEQRDILGMYYGTN